MPTEAAINAMLAVHRTAITHLSVHSAYSEAGASEIAVTRVASNWNAVSAKQFTQNGTVQITGIAASTVVRYIGGWGALSGGTFHELWPVGGQLQDFGVDVAGDLILLPGNTLANNDRVVFMWGTAPGALTKGTEYFVVNRTTDNFQVSLTQGGAAINITSQHDGECKVSRIVPWTADGGPLAITSLTFAGNA